MKDIRLSDLSDQELLERKKKSKSNNIVNAGFCGLLIGVTVYSAVKNGFGFFTFFPLVIAYIAFRFKPDDKALDEEIKSRNLL